MSLSFSPIQINLADVTNIVEEERRPKARIYREPVQFRPSDGQEKGMKQELMSPKQDGSCAQTQEPLSLQCNRSTHFSRRYRILILSFAVRSDRRVRNSVACSRHSRGCSTITTGANQLFGPV